MDRCPKDEPTAKNLGCKSSYSHFREKLEKPVEGGGGGVASTLPLAIGGLIYAIDILMI